MKLRIQDNSVRFRLTLKEIEELNADGVVERMMRFPGTAGSQVFRYSIRVRNDISESRVAGSDGGLVLELCGADLQELCAPDREGVYLRREWKDAGGEHRFIAFVEKDRPGAGCEKPEAWIYDAKPGMAPETRPIPRG